MRQGLFSCSTFSSEVESKLVEVLSTRIRYEDWKEAHRATGIAKRCDTVILDVNVTRLNKPIQDVKTVFVNTALGYTAWERLKVLLMGLESRQRGRCDCSRW